MSAVEKAAYANYRFLDTGAWKTWTEAQQTEFWKAVQHQKIPTPLPKPGDLGKDFRGVDLGNYKPDEYKAYERRQRELRALKTESRRFRERRERAGLDTSQDDIENERNRRKIIGHLQGKKMGKYESDPTWDDVVPLPQDDGEGALAQIAYTDEYAEGRFVSCLFYKSCDLTTSTNSYGIPSGRHGS